MIFKSLQERIAEKLSLDNKTGCWLWTGSVCRIGYAKIKNDLGTTVVHRILYELKNGAVPEGLELDHLCRVRRCVNPAHLEPVTHLENMRRGSIAQATHCKYGHEFIAENTRYIKGSRRCIECARTYGRKYAQEKQTVHLHSKLFCKRGNRLLGNNLYLEHTKSGGIKRRCRFCNMVKEQNRRKRS